MAGTQIGPLVQDSVIYNHPGTFRVLRTLINVCCAVSEYLYHNHLALGEVILVGCIQGLADYAKFCM